MRKLFITAAAVIGLTVTAMNAAELPKAFLGDWQRDAPNNIEITGIFVSEHAYHEPGYNCDIRSVQQKSDLVGANPIYLVEMRCSGDEEGSGHPQLAREVWAMRRVGDREVLAIAATSGASFPSIHLLRRPDAPGQR
jgi:hypothetical protein